MVIVLLCCLRPVWLCHETLPLRNASEGDRVSVTAESCERPENWFFSGYPIGCLALLGTVLGAIGVVVVFCDKERERGGGG